MGPEQGSGMYMLLGGLVIVAVLFFFGRGIGPMMRQSEEAPKDWGGLVFPLLFVVVLVVFVAMMLRR